MYCICKKNVKKNAQGGKKELLLDICRFLKYFKIPNFIEIQKIILFSDYCGNIGS